jgi:F-type H+-transporting ATPase subunit b
MGHPLMRHKSIFQIATVFVCLMMAGSLSAQDHGEASETTHAEVAEQAHGEANQAADHAADAGAHGAGHAERELITVKWQEAVYTIVVFGIFFVVLSIFVWPKILASLQVREEKVRGDLKEAEDAAKSASSTLAEYKQQLADAQKQAQQIVDESRGAAQQVAAQLKDQAQAELTKMRQRAEADIAAAKERAVSEIYEQTATLATQVAGQILRREINAGDQESLVRESIAKLNDAGQN